MSVFKPAISSFNWQTLTTPLLLFMCQFTRRPHLSFEICKTLLKATKPTKTKHYFLSKTKTELSKAEQLIKGQDQVIIMFRLQLLIRTLDCGGGQKMVGFLFPVKKDSVIKVERGKGSSFYRPKMKECTVLPAHKVNSSCHLEFFLHKIFIPFKIKLNQ